MVASVKTLLLLSVDLDTFASGHAPDFKRMRHMRPFPASEKEIGQQNFAKKKNVVVVLNKVYIYIHYIIAIAIFLEKHV